MGGNHLDAYDPTNGRQLWYLPGLTGGRTVTGPTAAGGLIYVTRGMRGPLLAIRPGGKGELGNDAIVWRYDQGTPDTPCPVVWNELVVTITDNGIAAAFDALSGKLRWKERLKGDYKASPLAVEGRIYFLNTTGLCTVVSASPRFEKLAENQLPADTLASPAAAAGNLYLRTRDALVLPGREILGQSLMKRIAWLTDIHLNFLSADRVDEFLATVAAERPDAVLIGGDIAESPDICDYLDRLNDALAAPIYFVLGNHDYYLGSIAETRARVVAFCHQRPGLHFLTGAAAACELTRTWAWSGTTAGPTAARATTCGR